MATLTLAQGTGITYKASGGTRVITLTSLANNTGRKGDAHDFGASFPNLVRVELTTKYTVAPTAGKTIDLYWATSADNTAFDGALAGGDAAQNDFNVVYQMQPIGSLVCLAITTVQRASFLFKLPARYGFLVVMNNATGQALSSTATDHQVLITPINSVIQ